MLVLCLKFQLLILAPSTTGFGLKITAPTTTTASTGFGLGGGLTAQTGTTTTGIGGLGGGLTTTTPASTGFGGGIFQTKPTAGRLMSKFYL